MMDNKLTEHDLPTSNELMELRDEYIKKYIEIIKKKIQSQPFAHQWMVNLEADQDISNLVIDYIKANTNYEVTCSYNPTYSYTTFRIFEEGWKDIILKEEKKDERNLFILGLGGVAIVAISIWICHLLS